MPSPRRAAIIRFLRGLVYASAGAAVAFGMQELPGLAPVLPAPELSAPVLAAALLAADKWIRARRALSR